MNSAHLIALCCALGLHLLFQCMAEMRWSKYERVTELTFLLNCPMCLWTYLPVEVDLLSYKDEPGATCPPQEYLCRDVRFSHLSVCKQECTRRRCRNTGRESETIYSSKLVFQRMFQEGLSCNTLLRRDQTSKVARNQLESDFSTLQCVKMQNAQIGRFLLSPLFLHPGCIPQPRRALPLPICMFWTHPHPCYDSPG